MNRTAPSRPPSASTSPSSSAPWPPSSEGQLRVVPLGGFGAIGMNCLALEQSDGILVIDCGIGFADEDLGVDTYYPRFSYLEDRADRVSGVFLTHGHEDHVGGLPYLLSRLDVPVFGPPHALAVARHRMTEYGLDTSQFRLKEVAPGTQVRVGPFTVEPIRVAHSTIDATALAIDCSAGRLIHTGDFRFDDSSRPDESTDESRLAELGDAGVRLLFSDSTNIDASRESKRNEAEVAATLDAILRDAPHRVVIGMFASNIPRLREIGRIAQAHGRRIALFGRSMDTSVQLGHKLERLGWPSDLVVSRDQAASVERSKLLVLAGGTQAEPGSALARLAADIHPSLHLDPGDVVVFSSRIIPGNEPRVFAMMGQLLRRRLVLRNWITDPSVHATGHADRGDQERMLRLTRPRAFIPVHGTRHHMTRHAELAKDCGVEEVLVLENGDVGVVDRGGLSRGGQVPVGRVATWNGDDLDDSVLQERRLLARGGALFVTLLADANWHLVGRPAVAACGVFGPDNDVTHLRAIALEVGRAVGSLRVRPDHESVTEAARLAARRYVESKTGRKPMTLVSIMRA